MTNSHGPTGQYPGGPNYHPAAHQEPAKKKRKWPWILGGTVLFFGLVGALGEPDDKPASSASSSTTTTTTTSARPTFTAAELEERQRQQAAAASAAAAAAESSRAAAAAAEAALTDPANYERLDERELALIARDPDSHVGRKIVIYGDVTQADSVTGNSRFRADVAAYQSWEWYDFDLNSVISVKKPNLIANVVEDDLVELFVEVKGAMSYNTTMGGNTTVPEFTAHVVNVYGSN